MKKEKTTKQLEDAWVCELANRLMDEGCMTRSEAFRAFSALRIVKIIAYSHTETRVLSSHRVTEDTELGTENLFINAGE